MILLYSTTLPVTPPCLAIMLDKVITMLDKVSILVISFVTTYFESCGDSLESVLVENSDGKATITSSSGKDQCNKQSISTIVYPQSGCFHCGVESRVSPLHDPAMENEETKSCLMKLYCFEDSDLVFFPVPSSEVVAFKGKHDPHSRDSSLPLASSIGGMSRDSTVTIATSRNPRSSKPARHARSSTWYQRVSPSSEDATKWIAMGVSNSKENSKSKLRRMQHSWGQDSMMRDERLVRDFPFDEGTAASSRTFTRSYNYRAQRRPPTFPRRRRRLSPPLALTTVAFCCDDNSSEPFVEKGTN
jgi:hypothetical protein